MDGSPASLAILPRMSVCLKGTQKLLEEPGPRFITLMDNHDGDDTKPGNSRRSLLSKSSVLLTGTSSSILATPQFDTKKSAEKVRTQAEGVRFSETVIIRNHIHVTEITQEERIAAWFRRPEYHAIFKNNTKIICTIGKREKEEKRMLAKKKREDKKKKKKRHSNNFEDASSDGSVATFNTDDIRDDDVQLVHILGIHRDDEQGFSVRGLENETTKKRRIRDQLYMKAKFVVLSIQEDVDEHMFMMQEEYEERLNEITNSTKKKSKRRSKIQSIPEEDGNDSDKKLEKIDALRKEFSQYASEQYHGMISKIAEDYGEICKKTAKDAFERGIQDERAVRAIDWIENEGVENYTASIQSSGKGVSDASPETPDKRRPSTASTAATVESAASLALKENQVRNRFGRMKRAKMFLWKIAS